MCCVDVTEMCSYFAKQCVVELRKYVDYLKLDNQHVIEDFLALKSAGGRFCWLIIIF